MDWFNEMYVRVSATLRSLPDNEEGQGLVEYAVLVGLITAAVIAVITALGVDVLEGLNKVEDAMFGNDA